MKIETGKFYKTRAGRKARIYATDGREAWVHGAVLLDDGWQADVWHAEGHYRPSKIENDLDLTSEWHEPKLRPWKPEEVPVGAVVKYKNQEARWMITGSSGNGIYMGSALRALQPDFVLEQCKHSIDGGKTWLPCGVEEEA